MQRSCWFSVVLLNILILCVFTCVATAADGNNLRLPGHGNLGPLLRLLIKSSLFVKTVYLFSSLGYSINFTKKVELSQPSGNVCGSCNGGLHDIACVRDGARYRAAPEDLSRVDVTC